MLVEGLNLQMKTSKSTLQYFGIFYKQIVWMNYLIGWLLPFLIVALASLTGFLTDSYMEKPNSNITAFPTENYEICWVSSKSLMRVYAVIIPIGIMTSLNIIFVVRSIIVVYRIKKKDFEQYSNKERHQETNELNQIQHGFKVVLLLTPVTGIPWILLFLTSKYILPWFFTKLECLSVSTFCLLHVAGSTRPSYVQLSEIH